MTPGHKLMDNSFDLDLKKIYLVPCSVNQSIFFWFCDVKSNEQI